jgi:hypothetical protein
MAIYHFSVRIISRSAGRSATAAAAYRAAERIRDERTGLVFDYTRKEAVAWKRIYAPANAPEWVNDRAALFNAMEVAERRKDAQVTREVIVALPHELSRDRQIDLLDRFVRRELVARGMVADVCLHAKDGNNHAHILLALRSMGADGFGKKNTDWNRKELLEDLRKAWSSHCNRRLNVAGTKARVDHRSLRAQGIDREPTVHEGPARTAMRRRGQNNTAARLNRLINKETQMKCEIEREVPGLASPVEMPPELNQRETEYVVWPVPGVPTDDMYQHTRPDYREGLRELFADDGARVGRGTVGGGHLRIVLRGGGELRDWGNRIDGMTGTAEEAEAAAKLAIHKGWKGLEVCGGTEFRCVFRSNVNSHFGRT